MTDTGRTVVANIALSLDGRVRGTNGEYDMGWILPHAVSDVAREHMVRVTGPATTALLGRKNFQGFGGYWPTVAQDPAADPRDRAFAQWLDTVEKVVLSTTLTEPGWTNARVVDAPAPEVVKELRSQEGGDIIVLASSSVIVALLEADEVDRLSVTLCPELVGGGPRLFGDGLPATSWTLTDLSTTDSGAICLLYDRVRA
ncbi:riboflavin biosynthesis protein RibD [Longispora fulva]|uniref:Dihydrofolate reductase n=1 Tax=Longispora fulva TaxID=619741 RepID=A0A8J7GJP4_9ACTN|nr:dihydrofolate reductase family protein [Longispora fulva]MBG6137840.1 dihydrofolate reductase [Longispora fulva]GIG60094.1 riboflavin biosynthesis protein RibD [Longispora fulva]